MFADPDPIPDPGPDKKKSSKKLESLLNPNPDSFLEVYISFIRIRIQFRIRILLSPRNIIRKNLNSYCSVISLFCFKKSESGSII
jgi:hypothetical protein